MNGNMKDVELYGHLIERFIEKMTSPEIGQFKLEVSTFRIILERSRSEDPSLVKFTLVENGKIINNLKDTPESVTSISIFLGKSLNFISSLIGEELARDIIISSMIQEINDTADQFRGRDELITSIPEPFRTMIKDNMDMSNGWTIHDEIIDLFMDVFQAYIKELSKHSDLTPLKVKLAILRERIKLIRSVEIDKNGDLNINREDWSSASVQEVGGALSAIFNSMVGLSTFISGKDQAMKKASEISRYYLEGKESLLRSYDLLDSILDGNLYKKVSTGLDILDRRMGGGIPKGSSVLLISPSGIERDILISGMLKKGLLTGSSALIVTSKEPPRSIRMMLKANDLEPISLEEEGKLRLIDWYSWRGERIIGVEKDGHSLKSSKILSNLGIAINKGLRELNGSTSKIGMIHMIAPAANLFEFNQVYNFIQRLRAKFMDSEMSSLFLLETDALSKEMELKIIEIFDGLIEISKTSHEGKFRRELQIRSLSGVDFDEEPIPFHVKDNCLIPEIDDFEEDSSLPLITPVDTGFDLGAGNGSVKTEEMVVKKRTRKIRKRPEVREEDPGNSGSRNVERKGMKKVIRVMKKSKDPVSPNGPDLKGMDLSMDPIENWDPVEFQKDKAGNQSGKVSSGEKIFVKPRPVRKRII